MVEEKSGGDLGASASAAGTGAGAEVGFWASDGAPLAFESVEQVLLTRFPAGPS